KISKYIKTQRKNINHDTIYIDIGDHIDLFHPLTEASQGTENVKILNDSGVDVATIGNNEGMTISHDALNRLYYNAKFDIKSINLFNQLHETTQCTENVKILNDSGVDVATIGNNEGMTISHDALNRLYDDAKFDITCCNLFDFEGELPRNITSHIIKEVNGLKICMIGLTAPFNHFYETLGWKVTTPLLALKNEIAQVEGDY